MEKISCNQQVDPQTMSRGLEVFVGGLPRTLPEAKVTELFADCGEIAEVRLKKDPSGKSKGYCFIRFATKDTAKKAIKEKSGIMVEGRQIGVLPSTEQTSLFLGNIRNDWSAAQFDGMIRQAFQDVVSVSLALPLENGSNINGKHQNRGFGFVRFSSHAAAARAYRVGSKADFILGGNWHPTIEWAQEEPEVDPEELAKVRIAFVRNLPKDADEDYLEKLFEPFGKVDKVVISSKNSSTVGFVHYDKRSDLENAINAINGKMVEGPRGGAAFQIQVEIARPMDKSKKRGHDANQSKSAMKIASRSNQSIGLYASSDVHKSKILKLKHSIEGAGISDPYEAAVLSLPVPVKERLLQILRLGVATRYDIDMQCLSNLRELPESLAIYVLDKFMVDGSDSVNKGAYLARLITELHRADKLGPSQKALHLSSGAEMSRESMLLHQAEKLGPDWKALHLSSATEISREPMLHEVGKFGSRQNPFHDPITSRESTLLNLSNRVRLPAIDNFAPDIMAANRHSRYTESPASPHHSLSAMDHTLHHQTSYGRRVETSPLPPRALLNSDPLPYQTGYRTVELPSSVRLQQQPLAPAYGRVESGLSADLTVDLQPRAQVRFDPYTGEPYKFDPFTGEPIRPDSRPRGGSHF